MHMAEEKNWLHLVVFWPPHACHGIGSPHPTHRISTFKRNYSKEPWGAIFHLPAIPSLRSPLPWQQRPLCFVYFFNLSLTFINVNSFLFSLFTPRLSCVLLCDKVSLCNPSWSWTWDPLASALCRMGLQMCATIPEFHTSSHLFCSF